MDCFDDDTPVTADSLLGELMKVLMKHASPENEDAQCVFFIIVEEAGLKGAIQLFCHRPYECSEFRHNVGHCMEALQTMLDQAHGLSAIPEAEVQRISEQIVFFACSIARVKYIE